MGLDIYVRWGNTNEDGDIIDGMTPEERQAQFTGFNDATEAGYLRYNWPGVRFVSETAEALGIQSPIEALWPDWEGSNGETLTVDAAQLERLNESKAAIGAWLANVPATFEEVVEAGNRDYFLGKMRSTVALIDFIEAHKDREGLRVEFN
jgi:hypothetical protein